jgi:AraC-like DNA-binding protein
MPVAQRKPQRPRPKLSVPTTLAYRIRTFGRIRNQPYHSTHGTHGADAMLTVVRSGRGFYLRGPQRMEVTAGMVGLVLPSDISGSDVGILMADPDDPYDHDYCRFAGEQAMAAVWRILALHDNQPFFHSQQSAGMIDIVQQMNSLFHRHIDFSQQPDSRPPTPMEGLLACGLAMLEMPDESRGDEKGITAAQLRRYLHDNLAQPLSLDHMADYFAISKEHLCRIAKPCLGMTIGMQAEQLKVDWACVLLRQKDMSIAEVARRVGYVDPLYFSKVFRKQMGLSPRQWRDMAP